MRAVTFDIENFSVNASIQSKNCNGIIFRNTGDVDATINGIPLPAGEKNDDMFFNQPGDVIANMFRLSFRPATLGVNPNISVVRKFSEAVPAVEECNFKR